MRKLLPLILILSGCSAVPSVIIPPTDLSPIQEDLQGALTNVEVAQSIAIDVEEKGAQPHDARMVQETNVLSRAETFIVKGENDLATAKAQVATASKKSNEMANRLNYLEPKYQQAVALVWKWRLIAIGIMVAIGAIIALKIWAKFPLPLPI